MGRERRGSFRRCTGLALVQASLLAMPLGGVVSAQPPIRGTWLVAETEHFEIVSDGRREVVEDLATNLETLHQLLEEIQVVDRRGPKTQVYAFRSSRTFDRFAPSQKGRDVAGFFVPGLARNGIAIDLQRDLRAGRGGVGGRGGTIYHELLHDFAETNLPGLPLWLNEGLAEFYSTFTVLDRRGQRVAELGRPVERYAYRLGREELLPAERFFSIDIESPEYRAHGSAVPVRSSGEGRTTYYAQAWAAVHYLLVGSDRSGQLPELLQQLEAGAGPEAAFREVYGQSFDEFDQQLQRYILNASYQLLLVDLPAAPNIQVRTASRAEVLLRLGELFALQRAVPEARGALSEAAQSATDRSVADMAHALLAWLSWREGDLVLARSEFARARSGTKLALPHWMHGQLELDVAMEVAPLTARGAATHPSAAAAQEALREAARIAPDWPQALISFGLTYLYLGTVQEGTAVLEQAAAAKPADPMPRLGLAVLLARSGEFDMAWTMMERTEELMRSAPQHVPRDNIRATGRAAIRTYQINEVIERFNARKFDAALTLADELLAHLHAEERAKVQPVVNDVRRQARREQAIAAFNRIVSLSNGANYTEALDELELLLDGQARLPANIERRAVALRTELLIRLGRVSEVEDGG